MVRATRQHEGDAVALLDTLSHERSSERIAQPIQLSIRHLRPFEEQGRMLRTLAGRVADHVQERLLGIRLQCVRNSTVIVLEPILFHFVPPCQYCLQCTACPLGIEGPPGLFCIMPGGLCFQRNGPMRLVTPWPAADRRMPSCQRGWALLPSAGTSR